MQETPSLINPDQEELATKRLRLAGLMLGHTHKCRDGQRTVPRGLELRKKRAQQRSRIDRKFQKRNRR